MVGSAVVVGSGSAVLVSETNISSVYKVLLTSGRFPSVVAVGSLIISIPELSVTSPGSSTQ